MNQFPSPRRSTRTSIPRFPEPRPSSPRTQRAHPPAKLTLKRHRATTSDDEDKKCRKRCRVEAPAASLLTDNTNIVRHEAHEVGDDKGSVDAAAIPHNGIITIIDDATEPVEGTTVETAIVIPPESDATPDASHSIVAALDEGHVATITVDQPSAYIDKEAHRTDDILIQYQSSLTATEQPDNISEYAIQFFAEPSSPTFPSSYSATKAHLESVWARPFPAALRVFTPAGDLLETVFTPAGDLHETIVPAGDLHESIVPAGVAGVHIEELCGVPADELRDVHTEELVEVYTEELGDVHTEEWRDVHPKERRDVHPKELVDVHPDETHQPCSAADTHQECSASDTCLCPCCDEDKDDDMVEVPIPPTPSTLSTPSALSTPFTPFTPSFPSTPPAPPVPVLRPPKAREPDLWRSACRERVGVLARQYGYSTIQAITDTQAKRYYAYHPEKAPIPKPEPSIDDIALSSSSSSLENVFYNYTADNVLDEDGDGDVEMGDSEWESDDDAEWDLEDEHEDMFGDFEMADPPPPPPSLSSPPAPLPIPSPSYPSYPTQPPTPAHTLPIPAPTHAHDHLHLNLPLTYGLDAVALPRLAAVPLAWAREEARAVGRGTPVDRGRRGEWGRAGTGGDGGGAGFNSGRVGFNGRAGEFGSGSMEGWSGGVEWLDPALRAYPGVGFDMGVDVGEWVPSPPTWPLSPTFTPLVVGGGGADGNTSALSRALG
ncbi:hypothetical protein NEOLEDRAFT_1138092 [Neolentinus lepideus HHB14362 ss-1]|uniref:Uncharacterized protein n=1 Tax=Neolentinus lepideus HHB14362 ss-1 TaxID=1314782 RepID=A0A165QGG3_9AGAM|nr:hypothetical protein NEOLEDRAFT_1138092 [Neolentinus lepideus HHB14362 ss-1]